jgi:acid phosphatase (class A)
MAKLKDFDYDKFKKMKPPKDNSLETFKEIQSINKLRQDKDFVKDNDDVYANFVNIVGKEDGKQIEELINDSRIIITKLKNYFNRPRPKKLAKNFGIKLEDIELDSMKTPSYPSGHSTQGYLVAEVLKDKYPNKSKQLDKKAKDISDSRNIARAHYKSDSDIGKKLGLDMAKYLKNNA